MAGETVIETILIYQEAYYDPAQMVLKVEAKEYSSSAYNNKVYLPLYGAVDVTVNWGDGQSEPVAATISTAAAMVNHTYAESGIYYVTISGTTEKLSGRLTNKTVAPAILEVRQWGKLGMTTLDYAFANTSLVTVPQPEEDAFAAVTSVENMFSGCTKARNRARRTAGRRARNHLGRLDVLQLHGAKERPGKTLRKDDKSHLGIRPVQRLQGAGKRSGRTAGRHARPDQPRKHLQQLRIAQERSRNILRQPDGSEQPHVGILRLRGARNPARRACSRT